MEQVPIVSTNDATIVPTDLIETNCILPKDLSFVNIDFRFIFLEKIRFIEIRVNLFNYSLYFAYGRLVVKIFFERNFYEKRK